MAGAAGASPSKLGSSGPGAGLRGSSPASLGRPLWAAARAPRGAGGRGTRALAPSQVRQVSPGPRTPSSRRRPGSCGQPRGLAGPRSRPPALPASVLQRGKSGLRGTSAPREGSAGPGRDAGGSSGVRAGARAAVHLPCAAGPGAAPTAAPLAPASGDPCVADGYEGRSLDCGLR